MFTILRSLFVICLFSSILQAALVPSIATLPATTVEVGEEIFLNAAGTTYTDAVLLGKARFEWDFGDGYYLRYDPVNTTITQSGICAAHYYMTPGNYTVTLKVTVWSSWTDAGYPVGTPIELETTTQLITVTGTAPISGFEIQRAPFKNRTKQNLYVQIPLAYRGNTNKLKVSLLGPGAEDTTTLLNKSNLAAEEIILFDQSSLLTGNYVIQTQLLNSSDEQTTGGIWRDKFYKGYNGTSTTYMIDENNSFRKNGELFFPITGYMLSASEFSKYMLDGGLNGGHTVGYYSVQNPTTFGQWLTSAENMGWLGIGPGRGSYEVTYEPNSSQRWKFNLHPDIMTDYINQNKTKAALFSWAWQDEPNLGGRSQQVYPPVLAGWNYLSNYHDPLRINFQNYYGFDWLLFYGSAPNKHDYLGSSSYMGGKKWSQPVFKFDAHVSGYRIHPAFNSATRGPLDLYLDAMDRMATNNKGLIPIYPSLLAGARIYELSAEHSSAEVYAEAWLNVIHGAKGISWFPYHVASTVRWDSMKRFSDQMAALKNVVLSAPGSRTVSDSSSAALNRVDTMIRESAGYVYVFAARVTEHDPSPSFINLKFSGTVGTIIPANTVVVDSVNGGTWSTYNQVTIGTAGYVYVYASYSALGQTQVEANTLTTLSGDPIAGLTSITNTSTATTGSKNITLYEPTSINTTFTVSGLTTGSVEVVDESRVLEMVGGVFTDAFAKNDVHIYKIDVSGESPVYHTVTVAKAGSGTGTVTSSPTGVSCGTICAYDFIEGNTITLIAAANTDSDFSGWSGTYGCTGTETCIINNITAAAGVTATFGIKATPPNYYEMTVSHAGNGTGTTSPAVGVHPEGEGTEVVITAIANENYLFYGWSGTCGCSGSSSPCTIASFPGANCTVITTFINNTIDITDPSVSPDELLVTLISYPLIISGTAFDDSGVVSCKWRLGAAPNIDNGTLCTGSVSWLCSPTGLPGGYSYVYVGCADAAGNWGSSSITVNYTMSSNMGVSLVGGGSLH
jgi:hypothetical protein